MKSFKEFLNESYNDKNEIARVFIPMEREPDGGHEYDSKVEIVKVEKDKKIDVYKVTVEGKLRNIEKYVGEYGGSHKLNIMYGDLYGLIQLSSGEYKKIDKSKEPVDKINVAKLLNKTRMIGNPFIVENLEIAEFDFEVPLNLKEANELVKLVGDNWRLPSLKEAEIIINNADKIKNHTRELGYTGLANLSQKIQDKYKYNLGEFSGWYWTNTEYGKLENYYFCIKKWPPNISKTNINLRNHVRLVRTLK